MRRPLALLAPEGAEEFVEDRQVLAAVDEQAAQRVVEVRPAPDVDMLERGRDVDHPPRRHVDACRVEQPAEANQVAEQRTHDGMKLRNSGTQEPSDFRAYDAPNAAARTNS